MPKKLQKSLQDYLSKIKRPTSLAIQIPSANSISTSKNWVLRGCRHPRTLSFAIDPNHQSKSREDDQEGDKNNNKKKDINDDDQAATLADIDRFLLENFKSLYIENDHDENEDGHQVQNKESKEERLMKGDRYHHHHPVRSSGGLLFESPRLLDLPPPPNLCGSNHFFVAPGSSGLLIDEAPSSLTTNTSEEVGSSSTTSTSNATLNDLTITTNASPHDRARDVALPDDCIAVLTYSPRPYEDFRTSMQEMVDARLTYKGIVDWDYMEEMLSCYMNLNKKKCHKFILSAFVDIVVGLRQNSSKVPARSRSPQDARERTRRRRKRTAEN